ncbi:MAG: hypothetical protein KJ864_05425 [Candidatus Omnitrophica bacterium]|nr:hypothetical protein [Candidatus Omnitrophota bacterium]
MYKICVFLIVAAAFLVVRAEAEEKFLEVYTFKKDRVDQDVSGNRGYVMGKAPEGVEKPRNTQRTLIGVDIMVGVTTDDEDETIEEVKPKPKKRPEQKKQPELKKMESLREKSPVPKHPEAKESVPVVENIVIIEETEENWIK